VKTFRGRQLHAADDPRIAAVVAIDVGTADLQQCVDAVVRLHAEWLWSTGRRDMNYRAASGLELPYERFARGDRIVMSKSRVRWAPIGRATSDHGGFRRYLDTVFAWANTVSVERRALRVDPADVRVGDFFVQPGNPGHAVMIWDMAQARDGRLVALLGQSYMPAQSLQVLRPRGDAVWFGLNPGQALATPFWWPFSWKSLRRLPD
jgi:hypothetical protein